MRRISYIGIAIALLVLGCSLPTPTPIVITATPENIPPSATFTGAPPTDAPSLSAFLPTATPTETATPSATNTPTSTLTITPSDTVAPTNTIADVMPPSELPPGYTGVIFRIGDCFDADMWGMVNDNRCDFRLEANLIIQPVNGALISSQGKLNPPSLLKCKFDDLRADRVAPNTNVYLCFRTNLGVYGFLVQREDTPFAPAGRMIFDYWIYKSG